VGSTAGVISGLSPGTKKAGEDLQTTYVPDGTTDIIIIECQSTMQLHSATSTKAVTLEKTNCYNTSRPLSKGMSSD
jgi:hypothetical protein